MYKKYEIFTYLIWVGSCVSYSYNILNLDRKRVISLIFFKIFNFCGWICYSYFVMEYFGFGWDNFDFLYYDVV